MVRIIAAAALALSMPFSVLAQATEVGVDQMKEIIMADPATAGMDLDLESLSDEQIIEINGVLQSDTDHDQDMKQQRIEEIVGE